VEDLLSLLEVVFPVTDLVPAPLLSETLEDSLVLQGDLHYLLLPNLVVQTPFLLDH